MRLRLIVGVVGVTCLAIVVGTWSSRRVRLSRLTPADLTRTVHPPLGPRRLTEGCPEVKQGLASFSSSSSSVDQKPIRSTTPLSEDEVAIYRAVLLEYAGDNPASLNLSAQTFPLNPTSPMSGLAECNCAESIYPEDLSVAAHSFHDLTPEVLPNERMGLVDLNSQSSTVRVNDPDRTMANGKSVKDAVTNAFASGLLSLSEITFDREHHFAWVSYSFWCGSLCGNGSTLVFEKIGGEWRKTDRNCGGWVS